LIHHATDLGLNKFEIGDRSGIFLFQDNLEFRSLVWLGRSADRNLRPSECDSTDYVQGFRRNSFGDVECDIRSRFLGLGRGSLFGKGVRGKKAG
jgi:hypothetical protein